MKETITSRTVKTDRTTREWTEDDLRELLGIPQHASLYINFGGRREIMTENSGLIDFDGMEAELSATWENQEVLDESTLEAEEEH